VGSAPEVSADDRGICKAVFMVVTRQLSLDDAPSLAKLVQANREFLAPWQPNRPDEYFTRDGQHGLIQRLLDQQAAKVALPLVILDEVGTVAGTVTLQSIIRGAFQSCSVGYWLAESAQGRGLATRAVQEATEIAFEVLRLHRVQAETLTHNLRSQRVLDRVGFVQYGRAEAYMHIAGEWQSHLLYQLLTPTPKRLPIG
jgi:ribosomal-protein-alanine N-acetyltransferase